MLMINRAPRRKHNDGEESLVALLDEIEAGIKKAQDERALLLEEEAELEWKLTLAGILFPPKYPKRGPKTRPVKTARNLQLKQPTKPEPDGRARSLSAQLNPVQIEMVALARRSRDSKIV